MRSGSPPEPFWNQRGMKVLREGAAPGQRKAQGGNQGNNESLLGKQPSSIPAPLAIGWGINEALAWPGTVQNIGELIDSAGSAMCMWE